ncbi:MAG: glycosyltransferase family 4 protein [Chitinophagaceae bacterium]|nr:glycosyltransferase family 4 protein [Chitinophagaceae bacterium]
MDKQRLIRITTIPGSLAFLLKNQLKFMNRFYEVHAVSSSGKSLEEVREREGVEIHSVLMTRTISPWKDLVALIKLVKVMRKLCPAIVHSHTPKAGTLGMIAAKIAGVPVRMHTVAGLPLLEARGNKRKLLGIIEKITYSCATMVYPNSFALRDIILQNKFCKKEKLSVIGNGSSNGIDISFFDPGQVTEENRQTLRDELGIKVSDKVFCFIGRIVRDKGIQELVEAFCRMKKGDSSVKLLLVGSFEKHLDPLGKETEDLISTEPDILFVGFQKDVRPYLAICDVFVFPSYREGFPNVVMQAGAMGVPCIVSNINGCNEIIEHKKNGWIVEAKNVDELKDAMIYLIENEAERKRMAGLSRQMIVSRYNQQYIWEQLLVEYRKQAGRD